MTDPRQFGLVCNLAGFDEVVKADSKSHHLGDTAKDKEQENILE